MIVFFYAIPVIFVRKDNLIFIGSNNSVVVNWAALTYVQGT